MFSAARGNGDGSCLGVSPRRGSHKGSDSCTISQCKSPNSQYLGRQADVKGVPDCTAQGFSRETAGNRKDGSDGTHERRRKRRDRQEKHDLTAERAEPETASPTDANIKAKQIKQEGQQPKKRKKLLEEHVDDLGDNLSGLGENLECLAVDYLPALD